MADRSGLCHGPHCRMPIEPWGPSEDFCSVSCQERWHAEANGSTATGGIVQRDGLYLLEAEAGCSLTTPRRDEVWNSIMNVHRSTLTPTIRARPNPFWPLMVVDETIPADEVQLRDPKTGALLARITGLETPPGPTPQPETGGEAFSRRPWWRRWFRRSD